MGIQKYMIKLYKKAPVKNYLNYWNKFKMYERFGSAYEFVSIKRLGYFVKSAFTAHY